VVIWYQGVSEIAECITKQYIEMRECEHTGTQAIQI